jgi:hypothetical protein
LITVEGTPVLHAYFENLENDITIWEGGCMEIPVEIEILGLRGTGVEVFKIVIQLGDSIDVSYGYLVFKSGIYQYLDVGNKFSPSDVENVDRSKKQNKCFSSAYQSCFYLNEEEEKRLRAEYTQRANDPARRW